MKNCIEKGTSGANRGGKGEEKKKIREVLEDGWRFKRGKMKSGTDRRKEGEEYFNEKLGP